MKSLLICISATLLSLATATTAQTEDPPEKPDQEQTQQDDEQNTKKPTVFKPSEELSEDYSVPFPTDI